MLEVFIASMVTVNAGMSSVKTACLVTLTLRLLHREKNRYHKAEELHYEPLHGRTYLIALGYLKN